MKTRGVNLFIIVALGPDGINGDIEDCLATSCTNKFVLSELTGISRDRLAYLFVRKGKRIVVEKDHLIIKIEQTYQGRQGVLLKREFTGFNRNI